MSVTHLKSGIVKVLFNTKSRWENYTIYQFDNEVVLRIKDADIIEKVREI